MLRGSGCQGKRSCQEKWEETSNGANQSGCSAPASSGSTGLEQACHPRAPAGNDSDEQRAPGAAPDNLPDSHIPGAQCECSSHTHGP